MSVLPTKQAEPSTPPEAQPEPSAVEQEKGEKPQWLTREDAERLFAERMDAVRKEEQRQRDKLEARVRKQYEALESVSAKISGQPLTDAQKAELRNEAVAMVTNEEAPAQTEPPKAAPAASDQEDAIIKGIEEVFTELDSWVEETDPEAKALLEAMKSGNARKILKAAEEAAEAKKARLAGNVVQTPTPTLQHTVLAGNGRPPANPINKINDLDTLWSMSRKK